jgi:hypothetical protein
VFAHAYLPYLHSIDPLGTHRRYRRSAFVAQYFFYKSFLLCTLQIAHAFASAFAGASLFDSFALMTFNTFYTSLQPVAYALDRDVPDDEGDGGGGTASSLGAGLGSGRHAVTRINHCTPTNGQSSPPQTANQYSESNMSDFIIFSLLTLPIIHHSICRALIMLPPLLLRRTASVRRVAHGRALHVGIADWVARSRSLPGRRHLCYHDGRVRLFWWWLIQQ